jgi:hypothetical protein
MGAKKVREEAWTLQQTTGKMTGAAPPCERPTRRKPGPTGKKSMWLHSPGGVLERASRSNVRLR